MVITGGGTGKTTVIAELVENLRQQKIPYYVVSFIGACRSPSKGTIEEGNTATMHRLMSWSKGEDRVCPSNCR